MDRGATQFSQSGLPSPYSSSFGDHHSEGSSADHASAAQYPGKQDYPTSVTPTSEYSVYPPSARSGSFSEHIQRSYHPSGSASSGGMAQQQNSPSMPQHNGPSHQAHPVNSDNDVPIDPSIAAPSPTYPYGQHSPYAPNPDMSHGYSHPSGGMYAQPRPDWAGYSQHGAPPLTPGHPVYAQSPASAPQQRPSQVRIRGISRIAKDEGSNKFIILGVAFMSKLRVARKRQSPRAFWKEERETRRVPPPQLGLLPLLTCMRFESHRSTPLSPSLERNSTNALEDVTRRLSACTSAAGTDARRPTAL